MFRKGTHYRSAVPHTATLVVTGRPPRRLWPSRCPLGRSPKARASPPAGSSPPSFCSGKEPGVLSTRVSPNLSQSKVESRKFEPCPRTIESRVSAPAVSNRTRLRPPLTTHEYATACLFFSLLTPLSCVSCLLWFCATDGVQLRLQEALPDAVFCNDSLEFLTVRLILRHFHVYLRVIGLIHCSIVSRAVRGGAARGRHGRNAACPTLKEPCPMVDEAGNRP